MPQENLIVEDLSDPHEQARFRASQIQFELNRDWLDSHWAELLPRAAGHFIAVAGRQAFVADTVDSAWAWVKQHHPDDQGAIVRFVRPEKGPRIYAAFR